MKTTSEAARRKRHARIRRRVSGSPERPRMCIFRSDRHIYVQIVDDEARRTLVAVDSRSSDFRQRMVTGGNTAAAKVVGELVAQRAAARGITAVVFDRGGYQYHGRVKALAEAARAGGLQF